MIANSPYVIVVTSPSRGVGKSTLATNLAVYLKALQEDLPVACLTLDGTAEPARMFQIGTRTGRSITELLHGTAFTELLTCGEFGVDYLAPAEDDGIDEPPEWLRKKLAIADYPGVLLIDAGVSGPLTQAAVRAADLLLVPAKDPADLSAITRLKREFLAGGGVAEQFWLLPSQLGKESSWSHQSEQQEFLRFASEERGLQVLKEQFQADQLVHEQACRQAKPVLTRLPQSVLHQHLRQLGQLALELRQQQVSFPSRLKRWLADGLLPVRANRIDFLCPLCRQPVSAGSVHYLEAYPNRRRLLLHASCVTLLLKGRAAAVFQSEPGLMLIQSGAEHEGVAGQLVLKQFDASCELLATELFDPSTTEGWAELLHAATGRLFSELYAEKILLSAPQTIAEVLDRQWHEQFISQRCELRKLCRQENF